MHCDNQNGVLALIALPQGGGEPSHPHLLGILQDFRHWSLWFTIIAELRILVPVNAPNKTISFLCEVAADSLRVHKERVTLDGVKL